MPTPYGRPHPDCTGERLLYIPSMGFCLLLAEALSILLLRTEPSADGRLLLLQNQPQHDNDGTAGGGRGTNGSQGVQGTACEQLSTASGRTGASTRADTGAKKATAGRRLRRAGVYGIMAVVLVSYAVRTWVRNYDWLTEEALFESANRVGAACCMQCRKRPCTEPRIRQSALDEANYREGVSHSCPSKGTGQHPSPVPPCPFLHHTWPSLPRPQVCPLSAKVQLNMGILQRRRGDQQAALAHFRAARAIEPGYCEPDYWIGVASVNAGARTVCLQPAIGHTVLSAHQAPHASQTVTGWHGTAPCRPSTVSPVGYNRTLPSRRVSHPSYRCPAFMVPLVNSFACPQAT